MAYQELETCDVTLRISLQQHMCLDVANLWVRTTSAPAAVAPLATLLATHGHAG